MALHIQNSETDRLARDLSAATGESITDTVSNALRERLDRINTRKAAPHYIARLKSIAARSAAMPFLESRKPDEILSYNEDGHFDYGT
ncbi:MAG: type II toxin-antitoxin system VapB family antitoxin [Acidobacteriaceae bacterium]